MGQEKSLTPSSGSPVITNPEKCSGCGRCVAVCAERLFSLELLGLRKMAVIKSPEKCTACRKCLLACPLNLLGNRTSQNQGD